MNNQEKAFEKLNKLKCGALFMEMGTGKTKVALDLINSKLHKINYILWICPVSLKNEILAEKEKWYPNLDLHIYGCESIGSSDRIYLEVLNNIKDKDVFCVVDESLKIKNSKTKRTQRILNIGKQSKYRLILNGTPVSKNVMDIWTQMEFLSPKILNMSEIQFKNTFCEYYTTGKLKGLVKRTYNTEYLISLIEPYIFDSKLDLNIGQHSETIYYENIYRDDYIAIKDEILNDCLYNDSDIDFYSLCTRLQQCYTKSYKNLLPEIIDTIEGKIIVFVKYLSNIPDNSHKITGSEKLDERKKILKQFENNEFKVLYLTYRCWFLWIKFAIL